MTRFSRFFVGVALSLSLIAPLTASAAGLSFGGRVTAVLPCLNGGLYVTVVKSIISVTGIPGVSALASPITQPPVGFYIWTPLTITHLFGPPRPGVQLLGISDIPYACVLSFTPPVVLPGLRMQVVGTSGIF